MTHQNVYGCPTCWPELAIDAWEAQSALKAETVLIDDTHFRVWTLRCPGCAQGFVCVFPETIDWADGEDPMYWTVLPITPAESASLVSLGDSVCERDLNALGSGRRSLRRDFPKSAEPRCYWGSGILVGPHD